MKEKRIDSFLLKLLYALVTGIVVAQVLERDSIVSILYYIMFPVTVLLWLWTVRKTLKGMDLIMALTIALALASVLLDAGINNANLGFDYLKKVIIFSMTLLFFQTANRIETDESDERAFRNLMNLLTLFLILAYFLFGKRMFIINGRVSKYLTFCMGNPNFTALCLTCIFMVQMCGFFQPKRWYVRLLNIVMVCFLVYFILLTRARNCLIAVGLYVLIFVWLVFKRNYNLKIGKFVSLVFAVFPITFVMLYMSVVYSPWFQKLFSFLTREGKALNSRVRIWIFGLEELYASPLIGAYYNISDGYGMSQMHNSHLDVAASYGIPVLILVCILLWHCVYQNGTVYKNKEAFLCNLAFVCAIVLGVGEAALFSGGLGMYVFVGSFLILARQSNKLKVAQ